GEVVTREELRQAIWGQETFVDFERGLNSCVKQIRLALGDDAESPRYIETLPRRGYRFIALLESISPPAAVHAAASRSRAPLDLPTLRRVAAALALILVLAGLIAYRDAWFPAERMEGKIMLAVLPFNNLSTDPDQEYFSDGLTEEMITQLGRLQPRQLGVIARTSAMRYKGTKKGVNEIGR